VVTGPQTSGVVTNTAGATTAAPTPAGDEARRILVAALAKMR